MNANYVIVGELDREVVSVFGRVEVNYHSDTGGCGGISENRALSEQLGIGAGPALCVALGSGVCVSDECGGGKCHDGSFVFNQFLVIVQNTYCKLNALCKASFVDS